MMPSKPGTWSAATTSWCQTCGGTGGDRQTGLLTQLTAQSRQRVLAGFDATAWGRPNGLRLLRHRRVRKVQPAEQDAVVVIKDDRADGAAQVRRHGMSDAAARR